MELCTAVRDKFDSFSKKLKQLLNGVGSVGDANKRKILEYLLLIIKRD